MSRSPMRSQVLRHDPTATVKRTAGQWMDKSTAIPRGLPQTTFEEDDVAVDGSDPAAIRDLVEDLREFCISQVKELDDQVRDYQLERKQVYRFFVAKVPPSVRNMTAGEFRRAHGASPIEILSGRDRSGSGMAIASSQPKPSVIGSKRDHLAVTPAPFRGDYRAPGTAARTVRRGEIAYSQNGSPLDMMDEHTSFVATVSKKHKSNDVQIHVNGEDGEAIPLEPEHISEMPPSVKAAAATQLLRVQERLAMLMEHLKE